MLLCSFNQWNNVMAGWGGSKFVNPPPALLRNTNNKMPSPWLWGKIFGNFYIHYFLFRFSEPSLTNWQYLRATFGSLGIGAPGYVQSEPVVLPTLATYSLSVITTIDRLCSATWISECLKQQNVQIRNEYLAQSC